MIAGARQAVVGQNASEAAAARARPAGAACERGEGMDAALAAPIYLRDKVALTVDERRRKKSA